MNFCMSSLSEYFESRKQQKSICRKLKNEKSWEQFILKNRNKNLMDGNEKN